MAQNPFIPNRALGNKPNIPIDYSKFDGGGNYGREKINRYSRHAANCFLRKIFFPYFSSGINFQCRCRGESYNTYHLLSTIYILHFLLLPPGAAICQAFGEVLSYYWCIISVCLFRVVGVFFCRRIVLGMYECHVAVA